MARFLSSNDPEALLQLMEDIDSNFSDDDFDGFIDENDENEKKIMIVFTHSQVKSSFDESISFNSNLIPIIAYERGI